MDLSMWNNHTLIISIQQLFINACFYGYHKLLKLLLRFHYNDIDIHQDFDRAFRLAVYNSHYKIVKILMNDNSINVHVWHDYVFRICTDRKIKKLLIE